MPGEHVSPSARLVISLGPFCMPQGIIQLAGFRQPTYPFDDIFSSMAVVQQAIDDEFAVFLDADDLIAGSNDNSWVQRHYREAFGQHLTFAHHDMRLAENRAKFARRAERFLALGSDSNPLFVHFEYSDRLPGLDVIGRLRDSLARRFADPTLLICTYGDAEPSAKLEGAHERGLIFRHFRPISPIHDRFFASMADNEVLMAFIREALMLTHR